MKRDMLNTEARASIKLSELLNLLQDNALGTLDPPLDQNRLHSIKILLAKTMPDLKAMEVQGHVDTEISIKWKS